MSDTLTLLALLFAAMTFVVALIALVVDIVFRLVDFLNKENNRPSGK